MSEINRKLALRWMDEVWNQRRGSTIDELMAPYAVGHSDGVPDLTGPARFRDFRQAMLDAFPNLEVHIQSCIAEGHHVVLRWRAKGTHQGNGLGIPPTRRPVDFWGISWLRFSDGLLVEGWDAWNREGLLQRLREPG
jgi:steroid delta-isomerase-like uncharacterized protein